MVEFNVTYKGTTLRLRLRGYYFQVKWSAFIDLVTSRFSLPTDPSLITIKTINKIDKVWITIRCQDDLEVSLDALHASSVPDSNPVATVDITDSLPTSNPNADTNVFNREQLLQQITEELKDDKDSSFKSALQSLIGEPNKSQECHPHYHQISYHHHHYGGSGERGRGRGGRGRGRGRGGMHENRARDMAREEENLNWDLMSLQGSTEGGTVLGEGENPDEDKMNIRKGTSDLAYLRSREAYCCILQTLQNATLLVISISLLIMSLTTVLVTLSMKFLITLLIVPLTWNITVIAMRSIPILALQTTATA